MTARRVSKKQMEAAAELAARTGVRITLSNGMVIAPANDGDAAKAAEESEAARIEEQIQRVASGGR